MVAALHIATQICDQKIVPLIETSKIGLYMTAQYHNHSNYRKVVARELHAPIILLIPLLDAFLEEHIEPHLEYDKQSVGLELHVGTGFHS